MAVGKMGDLAEERKPGAKEGSLLFHTFMHLMGQHIHSLLEKLGELNTLQDSYIVGRV